MEREVFILPDGKSFLAWEVRFGVAQQRLEIAPRMSHESDGSVRSGTMHITMETVEVRFCAFPGSLEVGQRGQLSSIGDKFFDVPIESIQPAGDHVLVSGKASRKIKVEWDRGPGEALNGQL